MEWHRRGSGGRYGCTHRGHEIVAERVPGGWAVAIGALRLRVRNPRLKTWLSARAVIEHVVRGRLEDPGDAAASVGHVGQGTPLAGAAADPGMPGSDRDRWGELGRESDDGGSL